MAIRYRCTTSLYNSSNTDNFATVVYQNCTAILKIVVKLSLYYACWCQNQHWSYKNATASLQSAIVARRFSKFLPIGSYMFLLVSHYPDFLITSCIHDFENYVQSIVFYGVRSSGRWWSFPAYAVVLSVWKNIVAFSCTFPDFSKFFLWYIRFWLLFSWIIL